MSVSRRARAILLLLTVVGLIGLALAGDDGRVPRAAEARAPELAAAVRSYAPSADAYVSRLNPKTRYGGNAVLQTQASGGQASVDDQRSYLRFNTQGASGETIDAATLRLYANSADQFPYPLTVRAVADTSWSERNLVWRAAPALGATIIGPVNLAAAGWVDLDVSSAVRQFGPVSFAVTTTSTRIARFSSREGANPPQLVLQVSSGGSTPTPTPTKSPTLTPTPTATPTSGPGEAVVVAVGDIACDPNDTYFNGGAGIYSTTNPADNRCHMKATSDLALGLNPAAVLLLGDNQYENGALSKYNASYALSWGRAALKSITKPAPGNHEYGVSGASGYFDYFGAAAGDRAKGYYSFDLAGWHLVALNTNLECSVIGCAAGSAQEQWLRNDLQAAQSRGLGSCTLAYWHHPRWSTGDHGSSAIYDGLWKALYAFGAELVLNGHDHHYERFAPQRPDNVADATYGIRELLVGTGGKTLYTARSLGPANSQVFNATAFGVLKLTLRPESYEWEFIPEPGSSFRDSGSGTCHGAAPSP
jgi:hypothetical protein